jgi:hypothetical protein
VSGDSSAGPDSNRNSTQSVNYSKSVLVTGVIADKHGHTTAKRPFRKEGGNRLTLSRGSRHHFDYHFTLDRFKRASVGEHQTFRECATGRRKRRGLPVVEREGAILIFQHHAIVA